MKKKFTLLFLLLFLCSSIGISAQVWENVGSATGISTGASGRLKLLTNQNNDLIVGYYDSTLTKGVVQKYKNGAWQYLGSSSGFTASYAAYNSTSVDTNDNVYFISQSLASTYGIEVNKYSDGAWAALSNPTTAIVNYVTSAMAPDNTFYVASGDNSGTIRRWKNGAWEQVGNSGFFGGTAFYLNMAIGTNGKIYISFNNNGYVHVYENNLSATTSDQWQPVGGSHNLVAAANAENYNSSLTIDENNNLFLAYVSPTAEGRRLNVKKYNGSAWSQLGSTNFSSTQVQNTSIAVNNNNIYAAASISDFGFDDHFKNYVVKYDQDINSWKKVGGESISSGQGTFNSLAFDSTGSLYLAYSDSDYEKLVVKKLNQNIAIPESMVIKTENNAPFEINTDKGTLKLNAEILPQTANQNVVWSITEGATFATISQTGLVSATASDATIKVKATSVVNNSLYSEVYINIKNQNSTVQAESIEIITPNATYPEIYSPNGTLQLKAVIKPAEANQQVTWQILEGSNVVTVNQNGLVTGLQEGYAIIKASHIDGVLSSTIRVNVYNAGCRQGTVTNFFGLGFSITKDGQKSADDFVVPAGTRFTLKNVKLSVLTVEPATISNVKLNFLKDDNGHPAEVIKSTIDIVPSSQKLIKSWSSAGGESFEYEISLDLPTSQYFDEGKYWMNPVALASNNAEVYWDISTTDKIGDYYHMDRNDGNGWVQLDMTGGLNAVFEITGNCTPMPVRISTVDGGTANVLIGQNLPLKATSNGSPITASLNWSVVSGNAYATINTEGIVTGVAAGVATIRAALASDPETYGDFSVTVLDPNACNREVFSNDLEDGLRFGGSTSQHLAIDIDVEEGKTFTVESISPTVINYGTYFKFIFYKDNNGLPGEVISTQDGTIAHDLVTGLEFNYYFHKYTVKLANQVKLTQGKYWVEIQTDAIGWETTTDSSLGSLAAIYNDNDQNWHLDGNGRELVYEINGLCSSSLGTSDVQKSQLKYYPNPVNDILSISSDKLVKEIAIINIAGQIVQKKTVNKTDEKVDVSKLATGNYIVNVTNNDGTTSTFKIIKK